MPKVKNFSQLSRRQQNRRLKAMQITEYFEQENISQYNQVTVNLLHTDKECHEVFTEKNLRTNNSVLNIVDKTNITGMTDCTFVAQEDFHETCSNITNELSDITNNVASYIRQHSGVCHIEGTSLQKKLIIWASKHKVELNTLTSLLKILKSEGHDNLPNDGRTLLRTPRHTTIYERSDGYYYHYGLENGIIDVLCQQNNSIVDNPIMINVNIDGLPIAKSSRSQLWPIVAQIVLADSGITFIIGAYHGYHKPSTNNHFLQHFITELKQLSTVGFTFQNQIYQVKIRAIICDTPARAFVTCTKGHNGYFGCSKCTVEGDYENHRMLFLDNNCPLRTDQTFKERRNPEHHTGISPFEQISIPMVTSFPLDYMHLICLGQMKRMLQLWFKGPHMEARLSGEKIKNMTLDMIQLKNYVCSEFVRVPYSFEEVDKWKATEFRLFLLYLSPVLLRKCLPLIYMKHFLTFHCAIRILCHPQDYIQKNKYSKELLLYFVQCYPDLYGKDNMIYTVHSLIHLSDDAKRFGPLDSFSAFPFENHLHILKNILRKYEKPLQQIDRRISEQNVANKIKICTKSVKYPILVSQNKNKLPFQCSESYDILQMRNYKLCCKTADRFCFLKNKKIVKIHHIGVQNGISVIIGEEFLNYFSYTLYPCDSRHLNVFLVNDDLSTLKCFPITSIAMKAMLLPWKERQFIAFPLLHSDILPGIFL